MPMPKWMKRQQRDDKATEMRLTAAVDFCAAQDKDARPTFSIEAYNGGELRVPQFNLPVVVDLKGARVAKRGVKVLRDHDPAQIVGHATTVDITDKAITASGVISGSGPHADEVVASSRNGFPWEASIQARKLKMQLVASGESVTVNGQSFHGPIFVARQSELSEISFVAFGADDSTMATVAATGTSNPGDSDMNFEAWLKAKGIDDYDALSEVVQTTLKAAYDAEAQADAPGKTKGTKLTAAAQPDVKSMVSEAVTAALTEAQTRWQTEQDQRAAIMSITAAHPDLAAKAVAEKWTREKAELEVIKAGRPNVSPFINTGAGSEVDHAEVLQAAVCMAGGLSGIDKVFSDKTLQAAHTQYRGRIGLQQMLLTAAWAGGFNGHHFDTSASGMSSILKAAFSTLSLPGILSNSANKFLLQGFNAVENAWRAISSIRSTNDFKQTTSYRLNGDFKFEKLAPDGEIKHGEISEESFTNQVYTHARMYAITRVDIINDDLGALTAIPQRIGRGGALALNDTFWTEFLADHSTFFATGNANLSTGAGSALSIAGLNAAVTKFRRQTDADGNPLALMPAWLLVPPELEATALEINRSISINTGGSSSSAQVPNANIYSGRFPPIVSAYLTSAAQWYLGANPADLAVIETVFLNGVQTPTVESADADFHTLGIQMRGYFDFGVNKQDPKAAVKSNGS